MEQKKLLLVIVSVGVFLVLVVGAGLLIFAPKPTAVPARPAASAAANPTGAPASVDANEWVKNPGTVGDLKAPAQPLNSNSGDVIIIYGQQPGQSGAPAPDAAPGAPGATSTTPDGQTSVNVAPGTVPPQPAPPVVTTTTTTTTTTAVHPKPVSAKPAAKPAKPAAAPEKKSAKISDAWWVQTGAFSTKSRADGAKDTLAAKGISSLVETKVSGGKTLYRVRIGPYSSKNEADYWLSLVKGIDGFKESYVTMNKAAVR